MSHIGAIIAIFVTGATILSGAGPLYTAFFGSKTLREVLRSKKLTAAASTPVPTIPLPRLIESYQQRARANHNHLRFGDPTTNLFDPDGKEEVGRLKLTDVYTPLSVATEFPFASSEQIDNRPVQQRIPVAEALSRQDTHRSIVLGDPGSGKSTLIDILVTNGCNVISEILPVHVRLSEIGAGENDLFWDGVAEVTVKSQGATIIDPSMVAMLEDRLIEGTALLLFDGLDEVSDVNVPNVIKLVDSAATRYAKSRLIVTCRNVDYYQEHPNRKLDFTKLRLLPFSLPDMIDYIDRWYSILERLEFLADAAERKRNLQDTIRNSSELSQLGATPLLLTLMALVHTTEGELPKSRAVLYHKTASHLLADSPRWRKSFSGLHVSQSEVLPIAQAIAFEIHRREESNAVPTVGLTVLEIESVIKAHLQINTATTHATYSKIRQRIDGILARIIRSNGLLVETSKHSYGFAHRSLQEFLAGMHFLSLSDIEATKTFAASPHWREPLILMAGYGGREGNALYFIAKLIESLTSRAMRDSDLGLPLAILSGEMLAEIGAETLRARGQSWVLDGTIDQGDKPPVWRHVVALLSDATRTASVVDQITILRVLGRIGDARLVDLNGTLVPITDRLSFLPASEVQVGDDGAGRPAPKSDLVATVPLRRLVVDSLHVSRYPVTNIEFQQFIEDDGYGREELWTDEGRLWLNGDSNFAERLQQKTKEWIERDFGPELKTGKYRLEDILRDSRNMSRARREPFYWRNARYNQPNQPVVGINLWEAMAFCVWLRGSLIEVGAIDSGVELRLPTEWEWERAARGTKHGAVYPWGNAMPTRGHAHTRADGLDLDYATPVGCFLDGQTDHGLFDVAGNVWEWTVSRALPPGSEFDSQRKDISGIVDVVVRGGSWFSDEPQSIRCGYRGIDLPQNLYYDVGFRVFMLKFSTKGDITRGESTKVFTRG